MRSVVALSMISLSINCHLTDAAHADGPATSSPVNWTSLYGGVHAGMNSGWGWSNSHQGSGRDLYTEQNTRTLDYSVRGVQLGGQIQFKDIIIGLEGDYSKYRVGGSQSGFSQTLTSMSSVRAKVGFAVGNFMPFVSFGKAHSEIDVFDIPRTTPSIIQPPPGQGPGSTPVPPVPIAATPINYKRTVSHNIVGIGGEYALTSSFSLRSELTYSDIGAPLFNTTNTWVGWHTTSAIPGITELRIGANYRFALPTPW
jgi:opacity protein-like surface antigen